MNRDHFWIAIGDIHEDASKIRHISEADQAEAILISGDITNRGRRTTAETILKTISEVNPKILAQIGNMDGPAVIELLDEQGINVHDRVVDLGHGVGLFGVGYSTPTPFNTPSEVSESQIRSWLDKGARDLSRFEHKVLMVHTPPYDTTTDKLSNGHSVGSPAVRTFIEKYQPQVCITGHIHEAEAMDEIGSTTIINPGMFSSGGYALILLKDGRLTARLKKV